MRLITIGDFTEFYIKFKQRGVPFIFSKATFTRIKRTQSAFNSVNIEASNWWMIPLIRERWNKMITGDKAVSYEEFISENILNEYDYFKIVSIGSGICSHEIKLAELNPRWSILCVDISNHLLKKAAQIAKNKKLSNISFLNKNIYEYSLPDKSFDAFLFHSSLHHFDNIEVFLRDKVVSKLKPNGKLIINEYVGVNRLQFKKNQIASINKCIKLIDKKYRLVYRTNVFKNRYYSLGLLRMIISDPSECIDSEKILPSIHKYFNILIERPFGGNILMGALKHISHHFIEVDDDKLENLHRIMMFEDTYLNENKSDYIFGVYELTSVPKS